MVKEASNALWDTDTNFWGHGSQPLYASRLSASPVLTGKGQNPLRQFPHDFPKANP